jgi:hypothetical protein
VLNNLSNIITLLEKFLDNVPVLMLAILLGTNAVYNEFTFADNNSLNVLQNRTQIGFKESELRTLDREIWTLEGAKENGTISIRERKRLGELYSDRRQQEREIKQLYTEIKDR